MQSARGVFYDLLDSNYIYLHGDIRFYFSSKFYLNKFSLKIDEFIKNEKMKFLVNYKIDIDAEINPITILITNNIKFVIIPKTPAKIPYFVRTFSLSILL